LALVLFGPKKLPELARGIGKALGELQKAKEDFHREISGVPQLPKIEPPAGMQPTTLENSSPIQSGATSSSLPPSRATESKPSSES